MKGKTKRRQATSIVLGIVLLTSIFAGAGYVFFIGQHNSTTQIRDGDSVGSIQNEANSTLPTHGHPGITNGTAPFPANCANLSQPYTPLDRLGPTTITSNTPSSYVGSITVTILCNGCGGATTSSQWSGTFGTTTSPETVSGICDASYMVDRPSSSAWQLSWSFQRLTAQGTLEISVSLDNNQTVVFDHSASGSSNTISGSLAIPSQQVD